MGYEPLHHKYRPQTFADLVGQEAIATTLTNAIKTQRIAPAYLLTGARGTGKTSTARIMAKSLNCRSYDVPTPTPCGKCDLCRGVTAGNALDITEIDAASNTGVDNIRELIERAQFAPVQARYKVYAIDECHMLSTAAFNALLKTLEEPPDRVVFILATTDPQRVLPTIISRCQRFDFRRIPLAAMVSHLQKIANIESIPIQLEAITLVSQIAQGGLRDAESLLDQLSLLEGEITVEAVWDLVGSVPERDLLALLEAIAQDNSTQVLEQVRRVMDRGREPLIVLQSLAGFYRDLLIAKTASDRLDLVALTAAGWERLQQLAASLPIAHILAGQQHLRSAEVQIKNTTQPRLWLEVTLLGLLPSAIAAVNDATSRSAIALPSPTSTTSPSIASKPTATIKTTEELQPIPKSTQIPAPSSSTSIAESVTESIPENNLTVSPNSPTELTDSVSLTPDLETSWQELVSILLPAARGLLAEHGRFVEVTQTTVTIGLKNPALKKIAEPKRDEIAKSCEKVFKRPIQVQFAVVGAKATAKKTMPASPSAAPSTTPSIATNREVALPPQSSAPPISHPKSDDLQITSPSSGDTHPTGNQPAPTQSDPPISSPTSGYSAKSPEELAIRNIVEFFNGQIINLDDDPGSSQRHSEQNHQKPS
jgi:DNA polymerase III subunit gamma/tau